jgi:hypothetical protein
VCAMCEMCAVCAVCAMCVRRECRRDNDHRTQWQEELELLHGRPLTHPNPEVVSYISGLCCDRLPPTTTHWVS